MAAQPDFDPAVTHFEYVMRVVTARGRARSSYTTRKPAAKSTAMSPTGHRFMERSVKAGKPFSLMSIHPTPHADRSVKGVHPKTGNGPFADMLAEMDYNSGRIIDALTALNIEDDTSSSFSATTAPRTLFRGVAGRGPGRGPMSPRWRAPCDCLHHPLARPGSRRSRKRRNRAHHRPIPRSPSWAGRSPHRPRHRRLEQRAFLLVRGEVGTRVVPSLSGHRRPARAIRDEMAKLQNAPDLAGARVRLPHKLPVPRLINLYDNPQERVEEPTGESAVVTHGWVAHAMFGYADQISGQPEEVSASPTGRERL